MLVFEPWQRLPSETVESPSWRYIKAVWTQSWATSSSRAVGPADLQSSLPTSAKCGKSRHSQILNFCRWFKLQPSLAILNGLFVELSTSSAWDVWSRHCSWTPPYPSPPEPLLPPLGLIFWGVLPSPCTRERCLPLACSMLVAVIPCPSWPFLKWSPCSMSVAGIPRACTHLCWPCQKASQLVFRLQVAGVAVVVAACALLCFNVFLSCIFLVFLDLFQNNPYCLLGNTYLTSLL